MSLVRHFKLFAVAVVPLMGMLVFSPPAVEAAAPFHGAPMRVNPVRPAGLPGNTASSTNWSGYAATGGPFTSVSSKWVQPSVSCTSAATYAGFWVGLDGYNDATVEQTGTLGECSGGSASYASWYELYPNPPVYYSSTVKPGDHMKASVTANSPTSFTMKISDTTEGWSHNVTKSVSSAPPRSSAEVIVEAPCCTSSGGILPLADFHTANFTKGKVNGTAIGLHSPTEIIMASGSTQKDSISALTNNENFTATWLHS